MSASLPGRLPSRWRASARPSFSPLYGDWMSASASLVGGRDAAPARGFSPLYGDWMSASFVARLLDLRHLEKAFQSPLWGLDECFTAMLTCSARAWAARFSPLYGDWMSASRRAGRPPSRAGRRWVSVPFMGIG